MEPTHSISYIGELSQSVPNDVILVISDADYVQACQRISRARGRELKIWVRSKTHFKWLSDFASQIRSSSVFDEKTARLLLAEKWNVALPNWLTDGEVLSSKLLEKRITPGARTKFETRYLVETLGAAFASDVLNGGNLAEIAKAVVDEDAKIAFKKLPTENACPGSRFARRSQSSFKTGKSS